MVGVPPQYTTNDELHCLFLIPEEGISRASLTESLNLGEGTTRSILDDLKNKGLIESSQTGHSLTERGKSLIKKFQKHISPPQNFHSKLYLKKEAAGLVVFSKVKKQDILKLRDHAIKRGADAAIITTKEEIINKEVEGLKKDFKLQKDSTLVICFAKTRSDATRSVLAVAQQIDKKLAAEISLTLEF